MSHRAKKRSVTVFGLGRFGELWRLILADEFEVRGWDPGRPESSCSSLEEALLSEVLFYAVPISEFREVLRSHLEVLGPSAENKIFIDLLSVKTHPKEVFTELLPANTQAILCHPLFGPDSVKAQGLLDQPIVVDRFRCNDQEFSLWFEFFNGKGLRVVEMSAEKHDRFASYSQGVTHYVGRLLDEFGFMPTQIDTLGARKLLELKAQVCNDTWQLFSDLQSFNPYTPEMRHCLIEASEKVANSLLPSRRTPGTLTVGIQGGVGSFNEVAALKYFESYTAEPVTLVYLFTSESVLRALALGEIDWGQFAIHNSIGGVVDESIQAMARYRFRIREEYAIPIAHALMIAKDAEESEIDTIVSHPQVFAQCGRALDSKYAHLALACGEGEMIDPARAAEELGAGRLSKNVAAMGNKRLAELYDLKVIAEDLQDAEENNTSFLLVDRGD